MMEYLSERFAPGALFGWLCVVFLAMIPLIWWRWRDHRRRSTVRYSAAGFLKPLAGTWASRLCFVLPLLRTLAVLAFVAALARPQHGGEYRDAGEGIAIQMVLDVSGSMAEEDFVLDSRRVRRLDAVKRVFEEFVLGSGDRRSREGDLIGMTTFAMYADTASPLTPDHGSVVSLLKTVEIPGWVNGQQVRADIEANYTALGDAIVLATDDLRRAGEQAVAGVPGAESAKSRVMILLTDGSDNPAPIRGTTPPKPLEAARVAAALGIRIYTIGAASDHRIDSAFLLRRASVDEPALRQIAEATGGKYFRATDTQSLKTITQEIGKMEKRKTGERSFRDDTLAARLAMLTGLGLVMLELWLTNTRFRKIP
jgi:Ca-activated chloride channel family protein